MRLSIRGSWRATLAKLISATATRGAWALSYALGAWLVVLPPTPNLRRILERCAPGWKAPREVHRLVMTTADVGKLQKFHPEDTRRAIMNAIRDGQPVGNAIAALSTRASSSE